MGHVEPFEHALIYTLNDLQVYDLLRNVGGVWLNFTRFFKKRTYQNATKALPQQHGTMELPHVF